MACCECCLRPPPPSYLLCTSWPPWSSEQGCAGSGEGSGWCREVARGEVRAGAIPLRRLTHLCVGTTSLPPGQLPPDAQPGPWRRQAAQPCTCLGRWWPRRPWRLAAAGTSAECQGAGCQLQGRRVQHQACWGAWAATGAERGLFCSCFWNQFTRQARVAGSRAPTARPPRRRSTAPATAPPNTRAPVPQQPRRPHGPAPPGPGPGPPASGTPTTRRSPTPTGSSCRRRRSQRSPGGRRGPGGLPWGPGAPQGQGWGWAFFPNGLHKCSLDGRVIGWEEG